jgi:sugar diacid utilization regulator
MGLRVLRKLGRDFEGEAQAGRLELERLTKQVGELVAELVRAREEAQRVKEYAGRVEAELQARRVTVNLTARIPERKARELSIEALRTAADLKGLLDELDERWVAAMNDMVMPQMTDRDRQWQAGRAEGLMEVKRVLSEGGKG